MNAAAWEQAKAVITAALRRPASERAQLVREQCGDTPLAGGGITGADLGNTVTSYGTGGEWNVSFAIGYDFRRR